MPSQGIPHRSLTDPQLHEIKGAAAAEINQVPVADGEGHAPFQTLSIDLLSFNRPSVPQFVPGQLPTLTLLNTSGLSATTTGSLADAASFINVNKNTKENAVAVNTIMNAYASLKAEHQQLITKLNSLISALENLGILLQENP